MARRRKTGHAFNVPRTPVQYPIATIAYYGPDDKTPTKVAVGIIDRADHVVALERWVGAEVSRDPKVAAEIQEFIVQHGAKNVVMTEGVVGCPHEEGEDFPLGEDCPFCPFWKGKQGTGRRE